MNNYPKYPECSNLKKNKKRQIVWNKLLRFLFFLFFIYLFIFFLKKKKRNNKLISNFFY